MPEKMLAYLLTKGKIVHPVKKEGYWSATLDFYGGDLDLALAFGRATIYYTMVDGQMNVFYFHDDYNFDWKKWGRRSARMEILTRMGSFIPGDKFHIYYLPFNNNE